MINEDDKDNEEHDDGCPTQDDLYEGLCIEGYAVHHLGKLYFEFDDEEDEGERSDAFWETLDGVISENEDHHLRIFHVNDHGNVTEFDREGNVIGEWV